MQKEHRDRLNSIMGLLEALRTATSAKLGGADEGLFSPVSRVELLQFTATSVALHSTTLNIIKEMGVANSEVESLMELARELYDELMRISMRTSGVNSALEASQGESGEGGAQNG
jgi:hypothetical protein